MSEPRRSQISSSATGASGSSALQRTVESLTDAATVTPDSTNDGGYLTSLSQTTTVANPTGSPTNFQQYILRIKSTASHSLTWGNQFRGTATLILPASTTGSNLTDYYGFQWNAQDGKWDLLAKSTGY